MRISFSYDKKKVLQALRYHFIWQPEIRVIFNTRYCVRYCFCHSLYDRKNKVNHFAWILHLACFSHFLLVYYAKQYLPEILCFYR